MEVEEGARIVLQENVERELIDIVPPLFDEEIRRMRKYDSEVCPNQWKNCIEHIKTNGFDRVDLFRRFGERKWKFEEKILSDFGKLFQTYQEIITNHSENLKKSLKDKEIKFSLELPLDCYFRYESKWNLDDLRKIKEKGEIKEENSIFFSLDDYLENYDLLFSGGIPASSRNLDNEPYEYCSSDWSSPIYGATKLEANGKEVSCLKLGDLSLWVLRPISERRFTYIFGMPPATGNEILKALIILNKFPSVTEDGKHEIRYSLKQKDIEDIKLSRGALLYYERAKHARDNKLFADIVAYIIEGEKVPIHVKDPVLVGIDSFGHRYPMVYWAGD